MRVALCFALFFASYALTCLGLRPQLPAPSVGTVSVKLEWWAQHAEDYDAVFFGSSRTFRQVQPEVFEKEMAAAGIKVRAFNLGIDGMRPPEDTYLMEQALALRKTPLKYVIVECNPIRLIVPDEDKDTVRSVYWHDWPRLVSIFNKSFFADTKKRKWRDRWRKLTFAWPHFQEHFEYWVWNNSNAGRCHEILTDVLDLEPEKISQMSDLGRRSDGYRPGSDVELMDEARTRSYQSLLQAVLSKPTKADPGDLASLEEIRKKHRLVARHGGQIVLVVPPVLNEANMTLAGGKEIPPVLDFRDPRKFPELYLAEHRADAGHLNHAGGAIYTRLIVKGLLPLLTPQTP